MGFDPDSLCDPNPTFTESLLCVICHGVIRDAVEAHNPYGNTKACLHLFCTLCIHDWLKIKSTCPTCRQALTPNQLVVSGFARKLVADQRIRCPNTTQGCSWVDTIGRFGSHVDNHIALNCPFEIISCPYDSTHVRRARKDMNSHMIVCDNRPEPCKHCNEDVPLREMDLHLQTKCPETRIACPNGCAEFLQPASLPQTRSSIKRKGVTTPTTTAKKRAHNNHPTPSLVLSSRLQITNIGCSEVKSWRRDLNHVGSTLIPVSSLRLGDLAVHRNQQCPLQIIDCPFAACGCKVILPRIDMERHILEWATTHHYLMNATLNRMKQHVPPEVGQDASEEESEEEEKSLPREEDVEERTEQENARIAINATIALNRVRTASLTTPDWRQQLDVGHYVDYLVRPGVWRRVPITVVRKRDTRILRLRVLYDAYEERWVPIQSCRIQPPFTRTTRGTLTILS